ncbi:hypothetical protein G1H11_18510 [Phytoactinopolyspora alkaliphila]|uniref:Uncharacterized protein n=1 Tax=Phytoactinopolyspora alkaliphila TaxID=1783498 RepID=A0A6N9YQP8_9ACTN|nr:hypothetical protein [Phytoactinopolyspora alkaliphila]NED97294.1 hypothetical protein [Phytoactinopolyspora alkaliphila]
MATKRVFIVHDEFGQIVSISRPAEGVDVEVLSDSGHSVFETDVDEDSISELVNTHRVDVSRRTLARY